MSEPRGGAGIDIRQAVQARVDATRRFARALVDGVCADNPDAAPLVRKRFDTLRTMGLLGPIGLDAVSRPDEAGNAGSRESPPDARATFAPIGPYQPLEEIGRGGQAVVYLAEDLRLNRRVALKVLKGLGALSEPLIRRFRREAEIASKLDHPGICPVYDAGVHDGRPYFAMRYLRGATLAEMIEADRKGRPPEGVSSDSTATMGSREPGEIRRILEFFEVAARALHAAHEAGIIHRDVKPGNIMVTTAFEPVLLDFGLAGDEDDGLLTLTETGELIGSPAYMSPEQLLAGRVRVDRRTDVYSLGVTLYEALTLERPYRAGTRGAMIRAIQFKEPIDIRSVNDALPAEVRVVVNTALEKDRDRRYQTALALAEDLRRLRTGEPITARPPGPAGRLWRWARRRPGRAALVAVLAVGIPVVAALAGHLIASRPAIRAAERHAFLMEVEGRLEAGFGELAHGDPKTALASFEAALALMPRSGEAIGGKALALFRDEQYDACLAFLDTQGNVEGAEWALQRLRADTLRELGRDAEADDLDPGTTERPGTAIGFFLAGAAWLRGCETQGDKAVFREAVRCFKSAVLSARHARPLYHFQLAHAAYHLAEEGAARSVAEAILTLWPDSHRAHKWAGTALSPVDRVEAIAAYRKALELNPDDAWVRVDLGDALAAEGRREEAVASYRRAIELEPAFMRAYASLGEELAAGGRLEEAIALLRQAIDRKPDSADAHNNLGNALLTADRLDEAIASFQRAIDLLPGFAGAHGNLGYAFFLKGRLDDAVAALERAVNLNPGIAALHSNLANALAHMGRYDEAIASCRKAIELAPERPEAYLCLGSIDCDVRGDYDAAVGWFEKAIACDANDAVARANLGNARMHLGQLDEAVAAFRKATALDPEHAEAHCHLGMCLRRQGELIPALAALRRGHELGTARSDWPYRSGDWLHSCESALFRKARRLASAALRDRDAEQWDGAAESLEALLEGWRQDVNRGQRKRAVERWLGALTGSEPWVTLWDSKGREGLAPRPGERWRKIRAVLDELVERLKR